jgi:hypothetical protein
VPTPRQLERAKKLFENRESRHLFYPVALELIEVAQRDTTARISVAEALSVLLQTWNRRFYVSKFRGRFPKRHLREIERLLEDHRHTLDLYRDRMIEDVTDEDEPAVERLFADFENVLGPVGAAKALHLLAHRFFPIWDREIAIAYGCRVGRKGSNGARYWRFMQLVAEDCQMVGGEQKWGEELLKRLDEFNFCHYTKGWM